MPAVRLPFAHLNLRRNPFGEWGPGAEAELAVLDDAELDAWARHLAAPRRALQLLGDHGRGKTTRLRALAVRLPGAALVRGSELAGAVDAPVVLLDEVATSPRLARARLLRSGAPLALGVHAPLDRALARAGYAVRTVRVGGLDAASLGAICARRVERARRGPGPVPRVGAATLAALLRRHGDDLRAILDELYDRVHGLEAVDGVV